MKMERTARILVGAAVLCLLLVNAGCNGTLSSALDSGTTPVVSGSVQGPGDWGSSLLAGGKVGNGMFPAKFTFDVTAAPSCTTDYVAFNTGLVASATSPSIVAYDNLYSTQPAAGGLCATAGPSVKWAYRVTTAGNPVTSAVLSGDGTQVAFVESRTLANGGSILHIMKWKPGAGAAVQGTVAAPALPDTTMLAGLAWNTTNCPAANSCIVNITFNGTQADTRSSPFYDYSSDTLYVGDDNGSLHKFTGVFLGTPAEVTTNWPIVVHAASILTGPVYDGVSKNIFVGDSLGRLSFVKEVGSTIGAGACAAAGTPAPTPCLGTANLAVGTGGAIVDAPIVDGTTGMVFAVNGTETSRNGVLAQANTALVAQTGSPWPIGGTGVGSALYSGAFDQAYFSSAIPTIAGHMYVCGKSTVNIDRPAIYQLSFTPATGVVSGVGTALVGLVSASNEACSPVTEFYNPNGAGTGIARDWIFFSIGNRAANAAPMPVGGACGTANGGCVISINVTGNPAWPPAAVTNTAPLPPNATGAASGIVVDNTSISSQASSFYFSLGANSTGAGPGVPSCNTTAGVGCAVKLTQSALN
jgi:hypothetical protein